MEFSIWKEPYANPLGLVVTGGYLIYLNQISMLNGKIKNGIYCATWLYYVLRVSFWVSRMDFVLIKI
jgi:hypothetical protein